MAVCVMLAMALAFLHSCLAVRVVKLERNSKLSSQSTTEALAWGREFETTSEQEEHLSVYRQQAAGHSDGDLQSVQSAAQHSLAASNKRTLGSWERMLPPGVSAIAVDGSHVYGIGGDSKAVFRAPKTGGSWQNILPSCAVDIAVTNDDPYVYVASCAGIVARGRKDGSGGWTQIVGPNVSAIAVDGSHIYGIGRGSEAVARAPKTGGSWQNILPSCAVDIAVTNDDPYVYVASCAGIVARGPKDGSGGWTQIVGPRVDRIAVDDVAVYGIGSTSRAVFRGRKEGGKFGLPGTWTQVLPGKVKHIVLDNDYIYGIGPNPNSVYRGDFRKPHMAGSWALVLCNDAGGVETQITSSTQSTESLTTETATTIGTEIEAGVIFKKAKVSVEVSFSLAKTWTQTWTYERTVITKCDHYQDGTPFTRGCLWQWNMDMVTFDARTVGWRPFIVSCTRDLFEPKCPPFQREQNGFCEAMPDL